jgi:hypothetical protein
MRHSGTITLFSERPDSGPPTISVVVSAVAHLTVAALIAFGIISTPRIQERPLNLQHYAVRKLDLEMPPPPRLPRAHDPGTHAPSQQAKAPQKPASPGAGSRPSAEQEVAQLKPAPQTLLQPKLHINTITEKLPLPTIVVWQMDSAKKNIILPQTKTQTAVLQASVDPPNEEINLDKIAITSSQNPSLKQPLLPSTTSPLVKLAPQQPQAPPQTTAKSNEQPTPAAILSLSDLSKQGPVIVPDASQTASSRNSGDLAAANDHNNGGHAERDGAGQGTDAAKNANSAGATPGAAGNAGNSQQAQSGRPGAGNVSIGQPEATTALNAGTTERIVLPKDGEFGAVIVGSSLEESFPEAAELWGGRLAYTVYLHVGLAKSWILQYSLPAAAEAAAGGNAAHLSAPWPYTMVRPNLPLSEINADALMIHGIVNAAGRFESLVVAFPPQYPQTDFVIASLRQWEFRPATQGGRPVPVEILLIIPGDLD